MPGPSVRLWLGSALLLAGCGAVDAWKIQPEDIAGVVLNLLEVPSRAMPSRVELRPTRPPR